MKLTTPLFSLGASGSIGKALTFSQRKTCHQVRYQKKQKDVITASRTAQRLKFLTAIVFWTFRELGDCFCGAFYLGLDTEGLERLATPKHMTGYNLFLQSELKS